jgi:hypothetical protein
MLSSLQKSRVSHARRASHVVGSQSTRVAVQSGLLFLSGTGALIFETLWLRVSGLAFGNSIWAAALILSSFMTGLALGNARRIVENPPMAASAFYAVLELVVAVFGCTIVLAFRSLASYCGLCGKRFGICQPTLLGLRFVGFIRSLQAR